jgi:hypothetical protein
MARTREGKSHKRTRYDSEIIKSDIEKAIKKTSLESPRPRPASEFLV